MFAPSERKFYGSERFDSLKIGETFSIDSGLGGSFTVEFTGIDDDGFYNFKNTNPGWKGYDYSLKKEELNNKLFCLVPGGWAKHL